MPVLDRATAVLPARNAVRLAVASVMGLGAVAGFASPAQANAVVTGTLTLLSLGTVYTRADLTAGGSFIESVSPAGGSPVSTLGPTATYIAGASGLTGTFGALSSYPNIGTHAATGPITDPTFVWSGPGPMGPLSLSMLVDGTYTYPSTPSSLFNGTASVTLAAGGASGTSTSFIQHTNVSTDATGAVSAAFDSLSCSPVGNCSVASHDAYGVTATISLPPFSPTALVPFSVDAGLFVQEAGSTGTTADFFHTASLSLVLPPGVTFVNDTGFPVTWVTSAAPGTSVPEPQAALVIVPALAAFAMVRSNKSRRCMR